MTSAALRSGGAPRQALLSIAVLCAPLYGLLVASQPKLALALAGTTAVVTLAFVAPLANLLLILAITVLVPYGIQNRVSAGGAGLLPSDALQLAGAAAAALALSRRRLGARELAMVGGMLAFLAVAILQLLHGVHAGSDVSAAGAEFRAALGYGTVLLALVVLADERGRRRFRVAALIIGIMLGLWGIAQWLLHIPFLGQDAGVREGVAYASEGRGQLQGGLFAFPIAIIMSSAALVAGELRGALARGAVWCCVGLNAISLLLTYERTLWLATTLGVAIVIARSPSLARMRAALLAPAGLALLLAALATVSPTTIGAARERLLSIGQYGTDNSLRYRVVESRHVIAAIRDHPIRGAGYGATIYWGRPWQSVPPTERAYSHNGYLWLGWKMGLPATAGLLLLIAIAIARRRPREAEPLDRGMRVGAQAALVALLIVNITFPAFNSLGTTAAIGALLALCVARTSHGGRRRPAR